MGVNNTDGLVNVASGLGTQRSKSSHNRFEYGLMNNWQQLDAAYQDEWLAAAIVDVPAQDATREWRTVKSDGSEDIEALEQQLCIPQLVEEAITWSRLYGGV